jgi:thiol-disulfide isomerase/thioredoxin
MYTRSSSRQRNKPVLMSSLVDKLKRILFGGCCGLCIAMAGAQAQPPPSVSARAAPLFSAHLITPEGQVIDTEAWRGQPLLINFWARWCAPCRKEFPDLNRVSKQGRVRVIGIALDHDAAAVRSFVHAAQLDYVIALPSGAPPGVDLMRALGNVKAGLPYTLAINRQGKIVSERLGVSNAAQIDAAIAASLQVAH